ncbi:MAG: EamA family transporter [Nocardiopsaceae bacterium]|nr:EamA family transporter [Nocardiopsaceae bacterium]
MNRGWTPFVLPAALVLTAAVSVQAGAGVANRMFGQAPPAAMTALRLWTAALILLITAGKPALAAVTGMARSRAWTDGVTPVSFGITLGLMNFSVYQAFARIPMGIAVTVEFLGPLAVAVGGACRVPGLKWTALGWAVLAGGGVVLLGQGSGGHLDLAGVGWALVSAAGWAGYILASRASGQRLPGSSGLVIAMSVAALGVTGPGLAAGGRAMLRPGTAASGAAIGLLSSVIPYWLEFHALRRVPARVFGVWMSLQPAVAAVVGLLLLRQRLSLAEWAGIGCVAVASAGAASQASADRASASTDSASVDAERGVIR